MMWPQRINKELHKLQTENKILVKEVSWVVFVVLVVLANLDLREQAGYNSIV